MLQPFIGQVKEKLENLNNSLTVLDSAKAETLAEIAVLETVIAKLTDTTNVVVPAAEAKPAKVNKSGKIKPYAEAPTILETKVTEILASTKEIEVVPPVVPVEVRSPNEADSFFAEDLVTPEVLPVEEELAPATVEDIKTYMRAWVGDDAERKKSVVRVFGDITGLSSLKEVNEKNVNVVFAKLKKSMI